jgi:hypothetical protein
LAGNGSQLYNILLLTESFSLGKHCVYNDGDVLHSIITFSEESKNCNPCFVRLDDITYKNTQTCLHAPPKQNTFNTSSSCAYRQYRSRKDEITSIRTYIHPNRPLSIALRILFQKSSFSDSGHEDSFTFQNPRSQSTNSRACDLQRKRDRGNNVARSRGIRGILLLFTLGPG